MALQRLLLGGEKEALLTELVRQKLQLRDLLRGEFSGPWAAGDLPDVGVDMVYGGVRIYLLPGYSGVDRGLFDQLAEISCDRQSGDGQINVTPSRGLPVRESRLSMIKLPALEFLMTTVCVSPFSPITTLVVG